VALGGIVFKILTRTTRCYFERGSIKVRSVSGSNRFCIAIGSTVTITSSVGDTFATKSHGIFSWVVMPIADLVRRTQRPGKSLVVGAQFRKHVRGRDRLPVVISQSLIS